MIVLHACLSAGCARPVQTDDDYCDECRERLERKRIEQKATAAIAAKKGWRGTTSRLPTRLRARGGGEQ